MRRVPALLAALLLPSAQSLGLGAAFSTATLLLSQAPSKAQSAEAVAKVAQAITVRIEGATQGSGVLVKRDGGRYTVLTAWHVVSGQRPGEELDVFTSDGQRHQVEHESVKRLGDVDMAVLTFSSGNSYEVAQIGDVKGLSMASPIYVSGFPMATTAVNHRLLRFLKGDVIANASVFIADGYQLLYSNQTLPGMSGGAVLTSQGRLVGIHGRGETDVKLTEQEGVAVKTGTNQGVPISYYRVSASGSAVVAASAHASSADDYLAKARQLTGAKGRELELIELANKVLAIRQSAEAYLYRGRAKDYLGDKQGEIADYSHAIAINPQMVPAYGLRGEAKYSLGDPQGAIADYSQAIAIAPNLYYPYYARAKAKFDLGDRRGAIADLSQAIAINPRYGIAYAQRASIKAALGDRQGAIADYNQAIAVYNQAIAIDPQSANAWRARGEARGRLGDRHGACEDMRKSASLGSSLAQKFLSQVCQ